jgi:hypothetical protein
MSTKLWTISAREMVKNAAHRDQFEPKRIDNTQTPVLAGQGQSKSHEGEIAAHVNGQGQWHSIWANHGINNKLWNVGRLLK